MYVLFRFMILDFGKVLGKIFSHAKILENLVFVSEKIKVAASLVTIKHFDKNVYKYLFWRTGFIR